MTKEVELYKRACNIKKGERERKTYVLNEEVITRFDELSARVNLDKSDLLELALNDFMQRYDTNYVPTTIEAGVTENLYEVKLYTENGNEHYVKIDEDTLAILERNIDAERSENFAQVYCHDDESVVNIRMDAIELYTVKEAQ